MFVRHIDSRKERKKKLILATSLTESCVTFVSEPTRFH